MDHTARREMLYYFAPGRRLFQIVVKIADKPGSLGRVLNLLGTRVNLVGMTSYVISDDAVIASGFAEPLSQNETAAKLRSLILSSGVAQDVEVLEGRDGMLVDAFHTGLETGGEHLILVRRRALTQMLNVVVKLLGSGGEVVLFQEGMAIGRANGEAFVRSLGVEKVRENIGYLSDNLAAQGWGRVAVEASPDRETLRILIRDCFECSSDEGARTSCNFFRGYIVGNGSVTFRKEFVVEETKCRLRGDDACEFLARAKTL